MRILSSMTPKHYSYLNNYIIYIFIKAHKAEHTKQKASAMLFGLNVWQNLDLVSTVGIFNITHSTVKMWKP